MSIVLYRLYYGTPTFRISNNGTLKALRNTLFRKGIGTRNQSNSKIPTYATPRDPQAESPRIYLHFLKNLNYLATKYKPKPT